MSDPVTQPKPAIADEADAHVANAGYKQQFTRTLGRFESFAVAFSFISITTGLFSTFGVVLNSSGPAGIWTWPIATVGTILVALVYGMLASRIPLSGFSYQWASRLANPVVGWWFGWVSFAFLTSVTISVDYAFSQVAASVRSWLADRSEPSGGVRVEPAGELLWVAPGLVRPGAPQPVRGRLVAWVSAYRRFPTVVARQNGRVIGTVRTPWPAAPGRIFRIPNRILAGVDPSGSPVQLTLAG